VNILFGALICSYQFCLCEDMLLHGFFYFSFAGLAYIW